MPNYGWFRHDLSFIRPAGTSRGVLHTKKSYILFARDEGFVAHGEAGLIPGLSPDNEAGFELELNRWCAGRCTDKPDPDFREFPALRFAVQCLHLDLTRKGSKKLFDSAFTRGEAGILTNGLIWMGSSDFMKEQIRTKIDQGYRCLKLKVGALDFDQELSILKSVRREYSADDLELRADANGAFPNEMAMQRLDQLAPLQLHSIEQPIKPGNTEFMAYLCAHSPVPIALDEELLGVAPDLNWLAAIRPAFLILKPALIGGFDICDQWISMAKSLGIGWWLTSALEGNIGLNAIAQYASLNDPQLPQGLGTGSLYSNNFASPLHMKGEYLWCDGPNDWCIKDKDSCATGGSINI